MMKIAEAVVFVSLATSLHIGVWAASPARDGSQAEGQSNQTAVVLQTASPAMAAVVRQWQRPPEIAPTPVALPMAPADTPAAPDRPQAEAAMPLASLPARPDAPALAPPPVAETEAPARVSVPDMPTPEAPVAPVTDAPPRPRPPERPSQDAALSPMAPSAPAAPRAGSTPRADTAPAAPKPPEQKPPLPSPNRQAAAPAGQAGKSETQSAASEARNVLQAQWGAEIQRRVHRGMVYPRKAKGSGTARVALDVDRSGKLLGLRLVRSSGVAAFDEAALEAVRRARKFSKAPDALSAASYSFTLSLTFKQ